MKVNIIIIRNYVNGLIANNLYSYLQQFQVHDIIPDKSTIYVYFRKKGDPLEKRNNGDHFAYLEPISVSAGKNSGDDINMLRVGVFGGNVDNIERTFVFHQR